MTVDLLTEKYRPKTLDGYVFKNSRTEQQIRSWIENPDGKDIPFPNLLFSGSPGTGKTTVAKVLCNELNVNPGDILDINASRENNVEVVREKILNFCSTWPIGTYKVIILDEFDGFSHAAQKILRSEMERHSDTVRFILTANYPNKILPALHSRLQSFHFDALDMESYVNRILEILIAEQIDFDVADIDAFVNSCYPDLRKIINTIDQHIVNKKLTPLTEASTSSQDYLVEAAELFKQKKYLAGRKLICSNARPEEYEEIYRFFYKNLELWGDEEDQQNQAIMIIAKGLRGHSIVADSEINLAATLVELANLGNS